MRYDIINGDTVYTDHIDASQIIKYAPRKKGKQWRKYYRLVHNFSKAYPYALVAKEKINDANAFIKAKDLKGNDREKFIKNFEKDLFYTFEAPLRKLTFTQGRILLRLIEREIGENSYEIIQGYKGRVAAGFWQGVARVFGSDLKRPYDREGNDKNLEELVLIYQKGEFDRLYYSIFRNLPPKPVVSPLNGYRQKPV